MDKFLADNDFGAPVAGNFYRNRYSGDATDRLICHATRCRGESYPFVFEGINDKPECRMTEEEEQRRQPRTSEKVFLLK